MKGTNKLPSPVATAKIQETSGWFDNLWTKNGGNGKEMYIIALKKIKMLKMVFVCTKPREKLFDNLCQLSMLDMSLLHGLGQLRSHVLGMEKTHLDSGPKCLTDHLTWRSTPVPRIQVTTRMT